MWKKILIGSLVAALASVVLWLGLGSVASAQPVTARPAIAWSVNAEDATAAADHPSDEQSGSESETDEGSGTETDDVDCQQEGSFEGTNAAGTGPGCDGSGT